MIINIEQPLTYAEKMTPLVRRELEKYFKDGIEFTIRWGVKLHTHKEKLKDFITTID